MADFLGQPAGLRNDEGTRTAQLAHSLAELKGVDAAGESQFHDNSLWMQFLE